MKFKPVDFKGHLTAKSSDWLSCTEEYVGYSTKASFLVIINKLSHAVSIFFRNIVVECFVL